ncbi:MAG TPA: metalloregulator ArsR/SmtB family transcription factor [Pirellulales bacterium]|nr:metalloregulator ArsR/SmtB family transcription factor [Pirellulales bacterium]
MISKLRPFSDNNPSTATLPDVSETVVQDLVGIFKLLSDETRLRILFFLSQSRELHVRALCEILGQSQPAVSHHLALLKGKELIESRREGKHNYYRVVPERFQQMIGRVFQAVPTEERSIRFDDYVLSYSPEDQ